MSYESDIPEDDLIKLSHDHEIKQKYYDDFKKAMSYASFKYSLTKDISFDIKRIKKKTDSLIGASQSVVDALEGFDKAQREFDHLTKNPTKDRISITLRRNPKSPDEVQCCREVVKADAELWRDTAKMIYADFPDDEDLKDSRKVGDPVFKWLVAALLDAWEAGGKEVGLSKSKGEFSGPMFRFFKDILNLMGIEKSNSAIGKAIEEVRNRIKKGMPVA